MNGGVRGWGGGGLPGKRRGRVEEYASARSRKGAGILMGENSTHTKAYQ